MNVIKTVFIGIWGIALLSGCSSNEFPAPSDESLMGRSPNEDILPSSSDGRCLQDYVVLRNSDIQVKGQPGDIVHFSVLSASGQEIENGVLKEKGTLTRQTKLPKESFRIELKAEGKIGKASQCYVER